MPSCSSGCTSAASSGATARSRTRSSAATRARSPPTSSTPRPASSTQASPRGSGEHDLLIAEENVAGELADVEAELGREGELAPEETAAELVARYTTLWDELTRDESFGDDTRYRIDERLHRLNELGFDVEELELVAGEDGYRLRLNPRVVEPGHHRRRLHALTGLMAQENQARRLLNDLARFRAELDSEAGRPVPETVAVHKWLSEVFEPAVAAIPAEHWGKRDAAEVFHEALEHRWFLSQQAGEDVGLMPAVERVR